MLFLSRWDYNFVDDVVPGFNPEMINDACEVLVGPKHGVQG